MQYGHPNCGWKLMHSNLMFGDGHDSWICVNSIHPTAEIFSNSLCWWYFQELWKKKLPPIWHSWVISIASYFMRVFFVVFFWKLDLYLSSTYCWFSWISNLASQAVTSILDLCCGSGVQGIVALRHYASNGSFVVGKHGASVHFSTWDSGWLKDDSPRTMGIWSSGLPELNRTGTEWNWKLVGTSKC